jgi:hypothetical protein
LVSSQQKNVNLLPIPEPNQGPDHESDGELGQGRGRGDAGLDTQAMVALDNKHNLAQREQYYAAVQKGIATHTVERVPGEFS